MWRWILLSAAVLPVVAQGDASAAWVRSFTIQQLYEEADRVVVGQVSARESFWNDAHDTIYTESRVDVKRTEKGSVRESVVVRQMGGQVGDVELIISGNASLQIGERVLLFLRDHGDYCAIVGMSQGKWSVRWVGGADRAYRGPTRQDLPVQDGERVLEELLVEARERDAGQE